MLRANLTALSFIEPELWASKVYIAGIGIFDLIFISGHIATFLFSDIL